MATFSAGNIGLERLPFSLGIQLGPRLPPLVGHAVADRLLLARHQIDEILDVLLVYPFHSAGNLV